MTSLSQCETGFSPPGKRKTIEELLNQALSTDDSSILEGLTPQEVSRFEQTTGECLLVTACKHGARQLVKALLGKDCQVNIVSRSTNGQPLFLSIQHGDEDIVRQLIIAGADIKRPTRDGQNALLFAIKHKASDGIIKTLISAGCSINAKDNNGHFPLFLAIKQYMLETLKVLTEAGADINRQFKFTVHQEKKHKPCFFKSGSCSGTVIHFMLITLHSVSSPQEHKTFVRMILHLVNCDVDISLKNSYGHTILDTAICNTVDLDIVEAILQKGCKANLSNVFQSVCFYSSMDTTAADLLYCFGFKNVNAPSERWSCPPLILSYLLHSENMMRWLLQHGADPNVTIKGFCQRHRRKSKRKGIFEIETETLFHQNKFGVTLLYIICYTITKYTQDYNIVKLLCEHGADVNAQINGGDTALGIVFGKSLHHNFESEKPSNLVLSLLQAGADPDIGDQYRTHTLISRKRKYLSLMLLEVSVRCFKYDLLSAGGDQTKLAFLGLPENVIKSLQSKPRSLRVLCRRAILEGANGTHLVSRDSLGQRPDPLYRYVTLQHLKDPDWYENPYTLMDDF